MYRIKENLVNTIEIQKSKFITYIFRVFSEDEVKEYLSIIKKEHPNATHHCYAYIINQNIKKSSDNGEPSGSAGVPILQAIDYAHLENTLIIVVRYFGGIKLGVGGLIRAYGGSASEIINQCELVQLSQCDKYEITFHYNLIGKIDYFFKQQNIEIINKEFNEKVIYQFFSPISLDDELIKLTNGQINSKIIDNQILEIPIKKTSD